MKMLLIIVQSKRVMKGKQKVNQCLAQQHREKQQQVLPLCLSMVRWYSLWRNNRKGNQA